MPHKTKELRRAYVRRWKAEHPELHRQRRLVYRAKNLTRLKAKDAARYRTNCGRAADDDTDRRFKVTPQLVTAIVDRYNAGETAQAIAASIELSVSGVIWNLRRSGVIQRPYGHWMKRYALNEAAFDTITEASAYWAGFLLTDGCINRGVNVVLGLALKDAGHLEKFRTFLGSNHPIRRYEQLTGFGGKGTAVIRVGSKRLCESLAPLGVTARKTFTAAAPQYLLNDRHFWRGVIDGDGSLYWLKPATEYPGIALATASEMLTTQFANYCLTLVPRCPVRLARGLWRANLAGTLAAVVAREMYRDCHWYLDRKQHLAAKMMSRVFKKNGASRSVPTAQTTAGNVGS